MRHLKSGRKLNRSASHRKAMLSNLASSVLDKERVTTTVAKAKEVRGVVERLITYGKRGGLHAIRLAARTVRDETVVKKLFDEIAPGYKQRNGGYTRVLKLAPRKGDNADLAIIELVGRRAEEPRKKPKKKRTAARKQGAAEVQADAAEQGEEKRPKKARATAKTRKRKDKPTQAQEKPDAGPAESTDAEPADMNAATAPADGKSGEEGRQEEKTNES
jgi:large subunit ribosomal protein L17